MLMQPTVYVVDEDHRVRESVQRLAESLHLRVKSYPTAAHFLTDYRGDSPGCLVVDIRPMASNGQSLPAAEDLQQYLMRQGLRLPMVALVLEATIQQVVQAMKRGAVSLLEKPLTDAELSGAIEEALAVDKAIRAVRSRLDPLTDEEKAVLGRLIDGMPNKLIAKELDLSLRTVEARRHNIFTKTNTGTVAELVKLVVQAAVVSPTTPLGLLELISRG